MTGALADLRVVDVTQMLAGPYCTMLLADQGAEVIKVESLAGDGTRAFGPFRDDDALRAFGGYYASVNRNKRCIALDLKSPEGRDLLLRLTDRADVVVENYRAGVLDRLGLGFETMRARNRKLVYASIRGFGDPHTGGSPYVDWPAYDVVAQAMGGIMGITGPDAETPIKIGPGIGDIFPATMTAFAIMAAVHRARISGQGQYVDVAMVDSVLSLCERIVHQHSFQGRVSGPEGNRHPILCPFGMVPARNGWITLACHDEIYWRALCKLIGKPELIDDPRCASNELRLANRDFVYGEIGAFTSTRTKQELIALLGGKVPFGPVYDVADIVEDPHFRARGMIVELDQPGSASPVAVAGVAPRLSETPGGVRHRAPLLGEHTDAILAELGCGPEEIAAWRAKQVVK
jgi:crotonobetainyl-CoA:carnitine CoA-transferase CaiB-like acyl-CoA transferase